MKVIIVAGGTGGHIYPGIAVAEEIKRRNRSNELLFVGSREGLEGKLVRQEGFQIELIRARGLLRKFSYKAISAPFVSCLGFFDALRIMDSFKPDRLISMGGYVSLPVVLAARLKRIPVLLHEQNSIPGIVNRLCSRLARWITLSFKETQKYLKGRVTGNPVRKRILDAKRSKAIRPTLLIMGGSQGALSINTAIPDLLDKFKGLNLDILHITGERDFDQIKNIRDFSPYPFYHLRRYMYNIEEGLALADLVVSRAGATAISEILALGIPSILIPFPYSAEGHQEANAKILKEQGAAELLDNRNLSLLPELVESIIGDPKRSEAMSRAAAGLAKRDAAKRIVDLINE
jgi:UDP-N-acetylglucosamine--N-acetylmuramyl-(pentapeptide) pyrophosphoryl-undecaprenol N-acetylglucosamine transferase